ncbi:MAG: phosphatidate cytidylyltransferase [Kangiellaceae bacterium]|jgi:phosphatidate cytidylyltransferase|nr:phosphatidate cytidylyltransferase [Kangiellaceae bacterium]
MLKARVITAVVLLPAVALLLFKLDLASFASVLVIVAYLMAWEWAKLANVTKPIARSAYALLTVAVLAGIWSVSPNMVYWPSPYWLVHWQWEPSLVTFWLAIIAWLVALIWLGRAYFHGVKITRFSPLSLLLGVVIITGFWVAAISIRAANYLTDSYFGSFLLLYMLLMIWAADVGGYFFGKAFGKRKLAPLVSPGKTIEGMLGGIFLSLVVAFIGAHYLDLAIPSLGVFTMVIILLTLLSVAGDLFESILKRQVQVKDSSQLLPGHGGLLDRLDSTLVVAPAFLLAARYFAWL